MVLEELFPRMPEVSWVDNVCLIILVLSAFNWVALAFLNINVINYIPEDDDGFLRKIVYGLIGLAGIKALFFWKKCLTCSHVE
ncbi:MAG TPA: DUF378 domain-containing protein [Candidatus Nanoarchaeia archaeon]|nr:DUF378 domain-containing protein [Candidatus Nanoarchaeia archaeon]